MARTPRILAVSALLLVVFGVFAFTVPLPYTITYPGSTADTLHSVDGVEVVDVHTQGLPVRENPDGELLLVTIKATGPSTSLTLSQAIRAYFNDNEAVVPRKSVYTDSGNSSKSQQATTQEMQQSQNSAVAAALKQLNLTPEQAQVAINLPDVGGPSAGLFFALSIVDKLGPDDLTGGHTIAGTGTIDADGKVGAVGGVPLKMKAAERDGANVFLLPRAECSDATRDKPSGLRLIPVQTLDDAVTVLKGLQTGAKLPSC